MKINFYQKLLEENNSQLQALAQKANKISQWRLINVLFIIFLFIIAYKYHLNFLSITALLMLGIFFYLVKKNNNITKSKNFYLAEHDVIKNYLARFSDEWQSFSDTGESFLQEDFPQAKDLDIFGNYSLYQYITVAKTEYGKSYLAQQLQNIQPQKTTIIKNQEAVKELIEKHSFALKIQALTEQLSKQTNQKQHEQIKRFIAFNQNTIKPFSLAKKLLLYLFPVITIVFILLSILYIDNRLFSLISSLCIITQLALCIFRLKPTNEILSPTYNFYQNIAVYQEIFKTIQQENFSSKLLQQLQAQISQENDSLKAFKQLSYLGEAIALRYNAIAVLLFNSTILWDLQCINQFNKWQRRYGKNIDRWLNTIGQLEMLMSLAVLANIKTEYSFPQILENTSPTIEFAYIKHPLLQEQKSIANSLQMPTSTFIITGSNMSGKTTFMRSIGLNLVLAYAGAPVLAENFCATCMRIFTSMRIEDSISKGISSFYAELLRLKNIVDYHQNKLPMLALIDEIFKGTNSADRIVCATEIIRQLSTPWSITIVTTHDFELCDLEQDEKIRAKNYHFTEHYLDNQIHFDHKIKPGRCQTTNAQQLLKMVGI